MSLRMTFQKELSNNCQVHRADHVVVDNPTDDPLSYPYISPNAVHGRSCERKNKKSSIDQLDALENIVWLMKLHYVLGITIDMSASWIVTNVAIGGNVSH